MNKLVFAVAMIAMLAFAQASQRIEYAMAYFDALGNEGYMPFIMAYYSAIVRGVLRLVSPFLTPFIAQTVMEAWYPNRNQPSAPTFASVFQTATDTFNTLIESTAKINAIPAYVDS